VGFNSAFKGLICIQILFCCYGVKGCSSDIRILDIISFYFIIKHNFDKLRLQKLCKLHCNLLWSILHVIKRFISVIVHVVKTFVSVILHVVKIFVFVILDVVKTFVPAKFYVLKIFISVIIYAVKTYVSVILHVVKTFVSVI
jgi:phage-related protein